MDKGNHKLCRQAKLLQVRQAVEKDGDIQLKNATRKTWQSLQLIENIES